MSEFLTVIQAVLPVFSIVAVGFTLRRLNWLTEEADASLLRVTINLLIPCLAFDAVLGSHSVQRAGTVALAPLVGYGTVALGFGVSYLTRRWAGLAGVAEGRTFALATGIYNYGYVPLPLATLMFDRETVAVLFVHNVGVELALWSLGLWLLRGGGWREGWRRLLNPPLVMIVLTLVLNGVGGAATTPAFVRQTAQLLGQCAIPLGLVLIGATLSDEIHEFHPARGTRTMLMACVVRLGVLPSLMLLVGCLVPGPSELKRVIALQAAMGSAVFPVVMAKHYGGDTAVALRVVVATTVGAFVTMPFWLRFGLRIAGD
ncbi:MAG TPA: AEC family transporter [Methylomirabilota bacterium]|nr:AEC family transporter [Methylomirabilota bacterium]